MKNKYFILVLLLAWSVFNNALAQAPIITDPANQTVTEGNTATFSVSVTSGTEPYSFQWQRSITQNVNDFLNIAGENNSSLIIGSVEYSMNNYWYRCIVSNDSGSVTSDYAILTVNPGLPVITSQPSNQSINLGESATFSISATSSVGLTYQWFANNVSIPGATQSTYVTPVIDDIDADGTTFLCKVTNATGTVDSDEAILNVSVPNERVTNSLQVLYDFKEGSGTTVSDVSGVGTPLDLTINNPSSVAWTSKGLNVKSEVRIKSAEVASKISSACIASNEITLEAWLLPSNMTQRSVYARILTISNADIHERNIALMQYGNSYYTQLRTDSTTLNGNPPVETSGNSQQLTHFVYTRDINGNVKIYINGVNVKSGQVNGTFANWANNYYLYLASEVQNNLFWEGTYYLTAIYSRSLSSAEVSQNYSFGADADNFPYIIKQPTNKSAYIGKPVTYSVEAIGRGPISYQWKKDGVNIGGETSSTLTFDARTKDDGSQYSCVVTTPDGSVETNTVTLTVLIPTNRIITGIVASYTFQEEGGSLVYDISGAGTPLNLVINNTEAISWGPSGLEINSPAQIISNGTAEKIHSAVTATNQITIEAWIKPANTSQTGPARILTYSENSSSVNFSLAQIGDEYQGKFRTSTNGNDGIQVLTSTDALKNELQHVVFVFRSDAIGILYVNGIEQKRVAMGGDFSNWSDAFQLGLGTELDGSSPWLGTLNYIAIFDRRLYEEEIVYNYEFGPFGITDIPNPTNLSATAQNFGEIELTWDDNTSKEDTYLVEKGEGNPVLWQEIATLGSNVVNYTDVDVEEGNIYYYRCRAYNSVADVYSDYSNIDTVAALLKAPSSLVGQANELGKVTLIWTDSSALAPGFKIERGTGDPVVFSLIDSVASNVLVYVDDSVDEGVLYNYRVFAYNANSNSGYSNVLVIRSKASFINAPSNLTAELDTENIYPVLNWIDNAFNEYGFIIERKYDTGGSEFMTIDTVAMDVTTYTDSTIGAVGTYTYRIFGYNDETLSTASNEASTDVLVSVEKENEIPKEFALLQNYPNPFNPSTTISFNLVEPAKVKLKVFNLLGQDILTLVQNDYNAGRHSITFDASELTSGIYVYSLIVEGVSGKHFKDSKKLVLLK